MADAEGTTEAPKTGLDRVDLAIIVGISAFIGILMIVGIVLCCLSRWRRKGKIQRNSKKLHNAKTGNADAPDGVYTVSGIDNPNKDEISESPTVVVTSEPTKTDGTILTEHNQQSEDIDEPYANVNKTKQSGRVVQQIVAVDHSHDQHEDHNAVHEGTSKNSVNDDSSSHIDASRNSPDGAPDPSLKQAQEVTKKRTDNVRRERHVSSTGTDVVSIDDDITKIQSNGQYLKVNHEISFSSTDDDHSSEVSKPSVVFGETKINDDYDHLRIQKATAMAPKVVQKSYEHDESFYSSTSQQNSFIIPPDSSGMARVFVNSNNSNVRRSGGSKHRNVEPIDTKIVLDDDEVFTRSTLDSMGGIPEHRVISQPSPRQIDNPNQLVWARRPHQVYNGSAHDHQGRRYKIDMRDNVSTYTDGGYALSEYVLPPPRYHYTSASTLGSIGRDRSHSIDGSSVYYVPSRRTSLGSGYSIVASTYDPRRYGHRRYVAHGKHKLHKPLSMFDLHKMKYRSYKGSLPPFNVPL